MALTRLFMRSELMSVLWMFRRQLLLVGLLSMVANVLMLVPTIYMLQVYDRVLTSGSETTLLFVSLMALVLFGAMSTSEWMRSRVLVGVGLRLDSALGSRVFDASFDAALKSPGKAVSRALPDLTELRQFLTGNGIFAAFDAPWTPVYIAVLFFMHPLLGWCSVGFALVQAALVWLGHRKSVGPSATTAQALTEANAFIQGKMRNVDTVEAMGMLGGLRQRWQERHSGYMGKHASSQGLTHRLTALSKFVRYLQQSLALAVGALLVIDGELSAGGMIAANVLMTRALAPIDMMVGIWRSFVGASAAFGRLDTLLAEHPVREFKQAGVPQSGALSLRDVVASVADRTQPILSSVSLDVPGGSVLVVLGHSGSGKSTLGRAMLGIWPNVAGEVLLDGVPVPDWDRALLGPLVGYLPQDVQLFDGTIASNIARGGEVDSEKVIAAAQATGLHNMILRFPKGYDTPMGVAGGLLSGGQRQRIGLARAIYGKPLLVVLDEPNANLDEAGEAALVNAVRGMRQNGTTVVLITHRPGVVGLADQLLVMDQGRVQFLGPRDQVLVALQRANSGTPPVAPTGRRAEPADA